MRIACAAIMALSFIGAFVCILIAAEEMNSDNAMEVWVPLVGAFVFGVLSIGAGITATAWRGSAPAQPKAAPVQYPPFGGPQPGPHTGQQPAIQQPHPQQQQQQWPGQA